MPKHGIKFTAHHQRRAAQGGWFMISAALALIIMSLITLYLYQEQIAKTQSDEAAIQADTISRIRTAAEKLVFDQYTDFQEGKEITRDGVTIPWGDSPGSALHPTVAQLASMELGLKGISDVGSYKSLTQGGYDITIRRQPAGCELSPSGVDCNITGLVCTDRPVRDLNSKAEVDALGIGKMLMRIGGNAGASLLGGTGEIIGAGGAWTTPNPIPGSPAGIVCARFGFGVGEYWNFLRVRDSRDPQFMNNVTLKGGLHVRTNANLGDVCTTEGMAVWGQINGNPVWLRCQSGVYVPGNGIPYAVEGSACTNDVNFGLSDANIALVCTSGKWVSQARSGLQAAAYYQHGASVPVPICRPGLTPSAVVAAVSASNIIGTNNNGNNTGSFQASISAAWQVTITGSDGSAAGNNAMALILTHCNP